MNGTRKDWQRYAFAIAAVALAVAVRLALDPVLGSRLPNATVFLAIVASAWYGGAGPAAMAVVCGGLAIDFFILEPRGSFGVFDPQEQLGLAVFFVTAAAIGALGASMHSARRRSEILANALARRAALIDNAFDAVLAWDWNGPITFWNGGAERLYGYHFTQATGKMCHELLHTRVEGGIDALADLLERDGRWEGELTHQTQNGADIVVDCRMVLVRDADPPYVIQANRNATRRKVDEAALRDANALLQTRVDARTTELTRSIERLRASESRFAGIVGSAMDAIISTDGTQNIVQFNAAAEKMFRCSVCRLSKSEVLGGRVAQVL